MTAWFVGLRNPESKIVPEGAINKWAGKADQQGSTALFIINLRTKQEVHNVAVFHHVFLALGAHFSGVFGALLAFEGDVVFKRDGLGADWFGG